MNTKNVGPFLGIDNRLPDYTLERTERGRKVGDYLRNAVNVDLTQMGTLRRRKGYYREVEGVDCHSLWSDGKVAYYVDGSTLYQYPRTPVVHGLAVGRRISYSKAPTGRVYWSNGVDLGYIYQGGSFPASVPEPNPTPSITVVSGGLPAGLYSVSFARIAPTGERSPATEIQQVELASGGGIRFSVTGSQTVAIYASPTNGDMLYEVGQTASEFTLATPQFSDTTVLNQHLRNLPAGHIVRWSKLRLLVAQDNVLYFSEAANPALYNPSKGYIPFPTRISIVEPVENGVWVVADKTYFLAGSDIEDIAVVEKLPYGAAEGSSFVDDVTGAVWWISDRGLVMAQNDSVKNVQEEHVATNPSESGVTFFIERDGLQQVLSKPTGADGVGKAAAVSFMEMEFIRKGSML